MSCEGFVKKYLLKSVLKQPWCTIKMNFRIVRFPCSGSRFLFLLYFGTEAVRLEQPIKKTRRTFRYVCQRIGRRCSKKVKFDQGWGQTLRDFPRKKYRTRSNTGIRSLSYEPRGSLVWRNYNSNVLFSTKTEGTTPSLQGVSKDFLDVMVSVRACGAIVGVRPWRHFKRHV